MDRSISLGILLCKTPGALPRSHFVTEHTEKLILKINLKPTDRIHHHVGQITTHHRFPLVGFSRRVGSIRCPYHRGYSDTSARSEEHTSELQSRGQLVCRLL